MKEKSGAEEDDIWNTQTHRGKNEQRTSRVQTIPARLYNSFWMVHKRIRFLSVKNNTKQSDQPQQ